VFPQAMISGARHDLDGGLLPPFFSEIMTTTAGPGHSFASARYLYHNPLFTDVPLFSAFSEGRDFLYRCGIRLPPGSSRSFHPRTSTMYVAYVWGRQTLPSGILDHFLGGVMFLDVSPPDPRSFFFATFIKKWTSQQFREPPLLESQHVTSYIWKETWPGIHGRLSGSLP